jgi:hypothetical protein
MRKLDVSDYPCEVLRATPENPEGVLITEPYEVKKSIVGVMFSQERLDAHELLERDDLAKKVLSSNGFILLEEAEYIRIKAAFEAFRGFRRIDVDLVRRVMNAPEIKVREADS